MHYQLICNGSPYRPSTRGGAHQWKRQTKTAPAHCANCERLRCQNYPGGGMKTTRCDFPAEVQNNGLVLCDGCQQSNITIDRDTYVRPIKQYSSHSLAHLGRI